MNWLAGEYRAFLLCPRDMRVLICGNMIFALVMPVIDIFVAAYVMRNSRDVSRVVAYQLAVYTGIPLTFALNGFLLGRIDIRRLYSLGMLLSGVSLVAIMSSKIVTLFGIAVCGLLMGVATGFFAANRALLALSTTSNWNRNYYYGVELFFYATTSVLVPLAIGWLIEGAAIHGWFGGERNNAYRVVAACACALTLVSSAIVHRGRFDNPPKSRFVYFRFHPLWYRMLWLGVLKGLAQGYIATVPAMLVLTLVGQEGALGTVQGVGGLVAAVVLYVIGRLTKPPHRILIFAGGLLLFLLGGVVNGILFNATGVLVLVLFLVLSKPLLDIAYFPIQFAVIDEISAIEGRDLFAYIFNHECAEYVGRAAGCSVFLALAIGVSKVAALKFALPIIGAVQLLSLVTARTILRNLDQAITKPPE